MIKTNRPKDKIEVPRVYSTGEVTDYVAHLGGFVETISKNPYSPVTINTKK